MSAIEADEAGHSEGIFSDGPYAASVPRKKDFLAWHRPRKHFVRELQWRLQIDAMLTELGLTGGTLSYLGLPGVDLLDLRHFHSEICEPREMMLRFLGFNSGVNPTSPEQVELNISLDEVRKLPFVHPSSEVIQDDVRLLARKNSVAWRKACALGPYDVVNLDLCDGFAADALGQSDATHYAAIANLLSLQARRNKPWMLFLTTRVGKEHVDADVLLRLVERYRQNLVGCPPFKAVSADKFSIGDDASLQAAANTSEGLLRVFLVGLCKWLVGLAVGPQVASKLEVRSVLGYRVRSDAEHEDLISLAIRFEPIHVAVSDPLALSNLSSEFQDECQLAVRALKAIAKRKDADALLAANDALNEQMIAASEVLLSLARYDTPTYRGWLSTL